MINAKEMRAITEKAQEREKQRLKIEASLTIPKMEDTIKKAAKKGHSAVIFYNMFHLYNYIKDYFEPLGFRIEPFVEPYDTIRISW